MPAYLETNVTTRDLSIMPAYLKREQYGTPSGPPRKQGKFLVLGGSWWILVILGRSRWVLADLGGSRRFSIDLDDSR